MIRILHLSDLHVSGKCDSLIDDIKTSLSGDPCLLPIDAVVISGDLFQSDLSATAPLVEACLETITDKIEAPIYTVPGNHDVAWSPAFCHHMIECRDDNLRKELHGAAARVYRVEKPKKYKIYNRNHKPVAITSFGPDDGFPFVLPVCAKSGGLPQVILILFNSCDAEESTQAGLGWIEEKQLKALGRRLATVKKALGSSCFCSLPKLAVLHHHLIPIDDLSTTQPDGLNMVYPPVVSNAARLIKYLAKYDIECVLHGHRHTPAMPSMRTTMLINRKNQIVDLLFMAAGTVNPGKTNEKAQFYVYDIHNRLMRTWSFGRDFSGDLFELDTACSPPSCLPIIGRSQASFCGKEVEAERRDAAAPLWIPLISTTDKPIPVFHSYHPFVDVGDSYLVNSEEMRLETELRATLRYYGADIETDNPEVLPINRNLILLGSNINNQQSNILLDWLLKKPDLVSPDTKIKSNTQFNTEEEIQVSYSNKVKEIERTIPPPGILALEGIITAHDKVQAAFNLLYDLVAFLVAVNLYNQNNSQTEKNYRGCYLVPPNQNYFYDVGAVVRFMYRDNPMQWCLLGFGCRAPGTFSSLCNEAQLGIGKMLQADLKCTNQFLALFHTKVEPHQRPVINFSPLYAFS